MRILSFTHSAPISPCKPCVYSTQVLRQTTALCRILLAHKPAVHTWLGVVIYGFKDYSRFLLDRRFAWSTAGKRHECMCVLLLQYPSNSRRVFFQLVVLQSIVSNISVSVILFLCGLRWGPDTHLRMQTSHLLRFLLDESESARAVESLRNSEAKQLLKTCLAGSWGKASVHSCVETHSIQDNACEWVGSHDDMMMSVCSPLVM